MRLLKLFLVSLGLLAGMAVAQVPPAAPPPAPDPCILNYRPAAKS